MGPDKRRSLINPLGQSSFHVGLEPSFRLTTQRRDHLLQAFQVPTARTAVDDMLQREPKPQAAGTAIGGVMQHLLHVRAGRGGLVFSSHGF